MLFMLFEMIVTWDACNNSNSSAAPPLGSFAPEAKFWINDYLSPPLGSFAPEAEFWINDLKEPPTS